MHPRSTLARRPLASLLVGCVIVFVGAAQAHATCGDYLDMSGHTAHGHQAATADSPLGPVAPKPCDGPSCRRSHEPVTPSSPTTWDPAPVRSAWLNALVTFATVEPQGGWDPSSSMTPADGAPVRLERPPRAG